MLLIELTQVYELYSLNSALFLIWCEFVTCWKKYFQYKSLLGPDGMTFCLKFELALHSSQNTGTLNDLPKLETETKVEIKTVPKSFPTAHKN